MWTRAFQGKEEHVWSTSSEVVRFSVTCVPEIMEIELEAFQYKVDIEDVTAVHSGIGLYQTRMQLSNSTTTSRSSNSLSRRPCSWSALTGLLYCGSARRNLNNAARSLAVARLRPSSARPRLSPLNPVNTSNDAGNEKCHRLAALRNRSQRCGGLRRARR